MRPRPATHLYLYLSCLSIALGACGGALSSPAPTAPPGAMPYGEPASEGAVALAQVADRAVIFRATMDVTVVDPVAAAARVESLVSAVSGYIDRSTGGSDRKVEMSLRVPAPALDEVMDGIRPLGEVEREALNSTDVTGQMIDLEARIESLAAVRDRLRTYIDRATTVAEIISIERELARVQTEIERLTGELERMRSQVAMSEVGLTLDRRHTPGPLSAAGKGVAWFIEKLFVWN